MTKLVTSFDVARLAGVSQPTVSRALRNLPGTSPATRQRVLDAARALSYVPSDSARALSTRVNRRVAVVSSELDNPYYPQLVEPTRRELARHGYRTVLITRADDSLLEALADGSYDGVMLTTTHRRSHLPRDLTERGIPHVLVNRVLDHAESPSCSIDNDHGSREVADLLVGLGHRRIGLLAGPVETSTGIERARGLRAGLRAHGVAVPRSLTRRCEFTHEDGLVAAAALLALPDPPTALVCGNDVLALGALSAAHQRGLSVPERLTVIGFDDIPMSSWPLVGLTTVHSDLDGLARSAVDLLVGLIGGASYEPRTLRLTPRLVLRTTHAAPPVSD